ncbi:MAG: hypothetical protein M3142_03255 [Bacteroidota bacterium]|nr:hypothetical protein [Bacteroidota bacterium]
MGKKKKHQSIYKAIRPIVKDNRVLYSMLGALSAGLGLGLALGTEKGGALVDKITTAVKDLGHHKKRTKKKSKPDKLSKPDKIAKSVKPNKLAKLSALEVS